MSHKIEEHTEIYSYPVSPEVSREKMIHVSKQMSRLGKNARNKAKRSICWICNKPCSSFCHSHSIPETVLKNIGESSEVSAPRQVDNLEPQKSTGIASAGIFFNICNRCDSKYFQIYEDEDKLKSKPSNKMMSAIALKNFLKMIYERSVEIEEEKFYMALSGVPEIVISDGITPMEYAVKSLEHELNFALSSLILDEMKGYYLCFRKELDYVVPYAAQYPLAMLEDLHGNVINDFYTGSSEYKLEYLHFSIFPLKQSSIIMIFAKNGEKRHQHFIEQLKKLDDLDQLSVINFLTFTGSDNVYINKTTYSKLVQNPMFMEACRLTYSVISNVPNPSNALEVALKAHNFEKRYELPNLLHPRYAIKNNLANIDEKSDGEFDDMK